MDCGLLSNNSVSCRRNCEGGNKEYAGRVKGSYWKMNGKLKEHLQKTIKGNVEEKYWKVKGSVGKPKDRWKKLKEDHRKFKKRQKLLETR